jgi:hypothetical protein
MHERAGALAVDDAAIAAHARRWIERFVIGLNLCPFAASLLRGEPGARESLRIAVCAQTQPRALAEAVLAEFEILRAAPADAPETTVLVFRQALREFDDYLDFLALAEDLLYECGLEGILQIASFHPDYQFEGTQPEDVSNFTNRAPYPMLHFLREESVSHALERYPEPERIPERNIERLRAMGIDAVRELLREIGRDR